MFAIVLVLAVVIGAHSSAEPSVRLLADGYERLPSLMSAELARAWGARVLAAAEREAAWCRECNSTDASLPMHRCSGCDTTSVAGGRKSFFRARRLLAEDAELAKLVRSRALTRAVARALGAGKGQLRLYQASAFVKFPGDLPSAWHQDSAASPLATDKAATLWLALSDVPASAGSLQFANGSHLPHTPLSLRDLSSPARLAAVSAFTDAEIEARTRCAVTPAVDMRAGDATLHLGWTMHAAPPNRSNTTRVALAVQYFIHGARVHRDLLAFDDREGVGIARDGELLVAEASAQRGIRFEPEGGGRALFVRLLSDDLATWAPWLHARPPLLVPGALVAHETLTPLLF